MPGENLCPNCGQRYQVERSQPRHKIRCDQCGWPYLSQSECEMPAEAEELEEGLPQRMGRFEIRRKLGAGAFGAVYYAHDPVLDRAVALKVLRGEVAASGKARTRFLLEGKAAAQLRHPNIIPVYGAGADGGQYFIAYAHIKGETLEDEIDRGVPDPRRSAENCRRLANALQYAHRLDIVHRDVKSSNVMVDTNGEVHLMDFGLARLGGSDERLTRDGAVLGTPAYMAPEQASTEFGVVGPHSDQYSLGVVLYELLCGQVPFSGPPTAVLYNVTSTEPASPRSIAPEVPRDLETICLKAMAKRPEQRYEDCSELAEDLRRWLADEAITARRVSSLERLTRWSKRNPIAALLIGTVAMLILLTAIVPSVGYYVVAGQVARREREEGRKRDIAEDIVEARTQLTEGEAELQELRVEAVRLRGENETLTTISQSRQSKLDEMRKAKPLDVLLQTVREHIPPGPVPLEPKLPPRQTPEDNSPPRPIPPPLTPLMIGQADELAAHVPENCFYARFGSLQTLQWLLRSAGQLRGPGGFEEDLQTQLCLPHAAGGSSLGDRLVAGLAIVGTCGDPIARPDNRAGGGVGIIIQAPDDASSALLGGLISWQRGRTLIQQPGTAREWLVVDATQRVSHIKSTDGSTRLWSFYAAKGNVHLITNSLQIVEGFLGAGQGVRAVASAEDFPIAERKMQQEPKPYAMLFIPKAFWSEPELAKLKPLTGFISEMDRAPDGHRSLSAEVVVPSCWIELLDAYLRHARWIEGPVVMPVYRLLAQHAPGTRLASVPGDRGFLEIALTDECRLFWGLHGSEWGAERDEFYHGIAGGAQLDAVLPLWQKANGFGARMLCSILSDVNEDLRKEGLDDEGYGGSDSLKLSISRRVFNGDWVALSPQRAVLEDVTPAFKKELAPNGIAAHWCSA